MERGHRVLELQLRDISGRRMRKIIEVTFPTFRNDKSGFRLELVFFSLAIKVYTFEIEKERETL